MAELTHARLRAQVSEQSNRAASAEQRERSLHVENERLRRRVALLEAPAKARDACHRVILSEAAFSDGCRDATIQSIRHCPEQVKIKASIALAAMEMVTATLPAAPASPEGAAG